MREHLRLADAGGVLLSVSCLPKPQSGPRTLGGYADWFLGQLLNGAPQEQVHLVSIAGLEQVDDHRVLAAQLDVDGGPRSLLVFTERAQSFYAIRYACPPSSWDRCGKEGIDVVRSFRVTDPGADRGLRAGGARRWPRRRARCRTRARPFTRGFPRGDRARSSMANLLRPRHTGSSTRSRSKGLQDG
jgi:hypothetical protein